MKEREPLISAVDSFQLYVQDLDEGIAFYSGRLHHAVIWRTTTAAGLRLPHSKAEIVIQTEREKPEVDLLVESADEAATQFTESGGSVIVPPFDIQIGRCVVCQDPWGNELVLIDCSKGRLAVDKDRNVVGNEAPERKGRNA